MLVYGGLLASPGWPVTEPTGADPAARSRLFHRRLPTAARIVAERTDAVIRRASDTCCRRRAWRMPSPSSASTARPSPTRPNTGVIFVTPDDFEDRTAQGLTARGILGDLRGR